MPFDVLLFHYTNGTWGLDALEAAEIACLGEADEERKGGKGKKKKKKGGKKKGKKPKKCPTLDDIMEKHECMK